MRYLWVEDFGEDSEDQEDKQEQWETYFSIRDNILLYTLEDALVFLDNLENRRRFDAVLLDIRFPVLSEESGADEEEIYRSYFSSFITREMFDTYASSGAMKDASSGILLFLALIFRYGYNWNNIAFLSANIDNEDLSALTAMKELMAKLKYKKELSSKDIALYNTRYIDLFAEEDGYISQKLKNQRMEKVLSYKELVGCLDDEKVIDAEIKKLNTIQEMINDRVPAEHARGLKYCSVRNQFRQIGLRMPPAFEKPTDESQDRCWLFREWITAKADGLMSVKRSVLTVCELLLERDMGNVDAFLKRQRQYNDGNSIMTAGTIRQYLQNIQRNTAHFPDIKTADNETAYAESIVEAVVSVWESTMKPHVDSGRKDTYYAFAYYAVMKLTRNWMAHQGVKGIDIRFAAFVFVISVKGIFDVDTMSSNVRKEIQEEIKKLIDLLGENPVRYQDLDVKTQMVKEYAAVRSVVQGAIPPNYKGKMRLPLPSKKDPFGLISALGHEDSCVRDSVSVNELYRVFWLSIYFGDGDSMELEPSENKDSDLIRMLENIYSYQK